MEIPVVAKVINAQALMSASTYGRRYGLMGMVGIAPIDDDDGNAACTGDGSATLSGDQASLINKLLESTKADQAGILKHFEVASIADMTQAQDITAEIDKPNYTLFILPDAAWAGRVSGVFANALAQQHPNRAHAMLTESADGSFLVSVRAPLATKSGADELCRKFPTGGGRKAAAGINCLNADMVDSFISELGATFGQAT